jgi:hypothetical protein
MKRKGKRENENLMDISIYYGKSKQINRVYFPIKNKIEFTFLYGSKKNN